MDLVAAGLKTIGDVRKSSDAVLSSIQNLGQRLSHTPAKRTPNQRKAQNDGKSISGLGRI